MSAINATQLDEVTFITGVDPTGHVAPTTFWTWNSDQPATYGSTTDEAKWGSHLAGTSGTINYAFDPASNWTAQEQGAFVATMALWSAVANVTFNNTGSTDNAAVVLSRATDGTATGGITSLFPTSIGSSHLGGAVAGEISIDTTVPGFGPLGAPFADYGGYPWQTLLHEEGHVLGLGHAGPYDDGVTASSPQYSDYDTRAWSIMSYNDPSSDYSWGVSQGDNGRYYDDVPTTMMSLDIAAAQRLYGLPTSTPLSGGQVFGFHSNIAGPVGMFFDFTVNTNPVVTLWDEGVGNTLDVSGFSTASTIDLNQGDFSSVDGLTKNISIAFGARIDDVVTGIGSDSILANNDGDTVIAGSGADTIVGGDGGDALYGNQGDDVITGGAGSNTIYGGQGDDTINGGSGVNYISGDLGNDHITGHGSADSLIGGSGDDVIVGGPGHEVIYGNQGQDTIDVSLAGPSTVYGGQGDDLISAAGNPIGQLLSGDLGNDTIMGGAGADTILGAGGDDSIIGGAGTAQLYGNAGNDTIETGVGASTVYAGQGNDLITVHARAVGEILHGDLGDDTIIGGGGADTIYGGGGADQLTGGGGADVFAYSTISDSLVATPDRILDFDGSQNHLDLTALNAAQQAAGNLALSYVSAFDGRADEIEVIYDPATNRTEVAIDTNGDKTADFAVFLNGNVPHGGWLVF